MFRIELRILSRGQTDKVSSMEIRRSSSSVALSRNTVKKYSVSRQYKIYLPYTATTKIIIILLLLLLSLSSLLLILLLLLLLLNFKCVLGLERGPPSLVRTIG